MTKLKQANCPTCAAVLRFRPTRSEYVALKCPRCGYQFRVQVNPTEQVRKTQSDPRKEKQPRPAKIPSADLASESPNEISQSGGIDVEQNASGFERFTKRLVSLGLVSQANIDEALGTPPDTSKHSDPTRLVRALFQRGKLTKYQAQEICAGRGKSLALGNYIVLDKLGDGGMGEVVKAQHRRMERIVALKILSSSLTKTTEAVQRFQREAKAAAKLEHPNIVAAYDADESRGTHFLVMQYVEGNDLAAVVRNKGPLDPQLATTLMLQVAQGLAYAHARGVIHRDIKPSNILVNRFGSVKILDMGLARVDSTDDTLAGPDPDPLTGTGIIMGTVDFMAPEQAMDTRTAHARSDIYSLGATLWYLLTARPLFESNSVMKKLMAHQNAAIPRLREYCPAASEELQSLVEKMVAKDPDDRYQDMNQVIQALVACCGLLNPSAATLPQLGQLGQIAVAAGSSHDLQLLTDHGVLDSTIAIQSEMSDTDRALSPTEILPKNADSQESRSNERLHPTLKTNDTSDKIKIMIGLGIAAIAVLAVAAAVVLMS